MNANRAMSLSLAVVGLALLGHPIWAQAQAPTPTVPPPGAGAAPPSGGGGLVMGIIIVVAMIAVVGVIVAVLDRKRKRDADAVVLQAQISDALLRDAQLAGYPITPTASLPVWGKGPATIQLTGHVPSQELRDAALRIARAEAQRLSADHRIEDHIRVEQVPVRRVA